MTISETAAKYVGQKELTGNIFKDDTDWGRKLHAAGQKDGDPYCALGCEVWAKEAIPQRSEEWDKLFSASAVQTFKNFVAAGFTWSLVPVKDSIVIWQLYKDGKPDWRGHAGVVESVGTGDKYGFTSIEANTSDGTRENRDGGVVARKPHRVVADVKNGLKVLGFIQIA